MKAKLLLHSGRLDPSWLMNEYEAQKLYSFIRRSYGTMNPLPVSSTGYGGITVYLDASETLSIFKGIFEIISNGTELRRFIDFNRKIETWIFSTSLNKIKDDVYNQLVLTEIK